MIYFIQLGDGGPIKIGYSKDIFRRLWILRFPNGRGFRLLALTEGDREREKWYHEKFEEHRIKGEWFRPEEPLLDRIAWLRNCGEQVGIYCGEPNTTPMNTRKGKYRRTWEDKDEADRRTYPPIRFIRRRNP